MFTNDNTECSTKISIISQNKFDQWFIKQSIFNKNWCLSNNFKGEKGKILKIPYDDGRLKEVVIGEGKIADLSGISSFSSTNIGNYFSFLKYSDSSETDVQKAWIWGQHQLRHKTSQNSLYVKDKDKIKFLNHYSKATKLSLDLINMPANELNPLTFSNIVKNHKLFSKFYFKKYPNSQIKKLFPLTYAVGKSSNIHPEFLQVSNKKINNKDQPIVIIGKGVTFDTGGVNIKPGNSMRNMKKDMGGASIALSLFLLSSYLLKKSKIVLLIPIAENSISSKAMRPGDVYNSRSGKTVEISHTDAEGRLLLADAMELANELNPSIIIDFATLTGAARVALGEDLPAYFCNDEPTIKKIEMLNSRKLRCWRLPLYKNYKSKLQSKVADLCNASLDGMAGSITAALFIEEFILSPKTPWVHFDTYAWSSGSMISSKGAALQGLDIMSDFLNENFS